MPGYDGRGELAPRDVVARSIQAEMQRRGDSHVLLDISHKPKAEVLSHFPNVAAHCRSVGVDITQVRPDMGGRVSVAGFGGANLPMQSRRWASCRWAAGFAWGC